jgi:hypothetical protein
MHDLLITKIERFDPTSESASVTLGCVDGQVVAFCFPCRYEVGDLVPNRLYVLDSTKLQSPYFNDWADEEQAQASRERLHRTRDYAYSGCGKVVDPHEGSCRSVASSWISAMCRRVPNSLSSISLALI